MAVKIRLTRMGAKKRPYYRIVVADARSPRDGAFIEKVGSYNPLLNNDDPNRVIIDEERVRYWLGCGAQPTDRVAKFLSRRGMLPEKAGWRGTGAKARAAEAKKAAEAEAPAS